MTQDRLKIRSLTQLTKGQDWRLALAHDRAAPLLIWITRGQGRLLLHGQRRGIGTHNAIVIPARQLFALDLGKQGIGQAVIFPENTDATLPEMPRLLRIRDVAAMSALNTLLEAASREQSAGRPLTAQSMDAYGTLMSVWVQRQLGLEEHLPRRPNAAARLSAAYCARITAHFADTLTMGDHAQALGVTATHLSRACKAATGKTAADLLTERILYEARALLVSTKVPAQDIARHLGFGSAAYFTRFIQHHTKASPTALRKAAAHLAKVA